MKIFLKGWNQFDFILLHKWREFAIESITVGKIVILNGTPRSGKSSIVSEIQNTFEGVWMNIGVDSFMQMTPQHYQPGIGLRPGGERPDLEPLIVKMYQALYETIALYSRKGLNIVVDVGHHDGYSIPRNILPNCVQILEGLPVWFVGVRCPIEIIMERRIETWKIGYTHDGKIPKAVTLWQQLVHNPGIYDLEVDTSKLNPKECAHLIRFKMMEGPLPTAFNRLKKIYHLN